MPVDERHVRAARALNIEPEIVRELEITRAIDPDRLAEAGEYLLERVLRRMQYTDLVTARERFRQRQQRTEEGVVPENALSKALAQLDSIRARTAMQGRVAGLPCGTSVAPHALLPPRAGLTTGGAGWKSLGPGNIGGRTRSLVVHPTNTNTMWAGSVGGGVWRTDDAGVSWRPVDDFLANLAISTIVIHPANPNVLFAGTGEGFSNADALRGGGIFTTDDGVNWRRIPTTDRPEFDRVTRLAISSDGKVLLASTPGGIWRSEDAAHVTWARVCPEPIADVDFDPTNSERAVAGGLSTGHVFFSDDGGRNWKAAATNGVDWGGRVELAYAIANPMVVYASVDRMGGQIWRSLDGGQSYLQRETRRADGTPIAYLGDQGWYDNVIWAGDRSNEDFVIVGGVDLWKSSDGGDTIVDISAWFNASITSNGSAHADQHCITAAPGFDGSTNKTVFFTNDGGIFKTDDVFTVGNDADRISGWQELVNTYEITQFYAGAGNPTSGIIIGGTQDNGTIRFDPANGAQQWTSIFGGDGGWCAADPSDPNYFYGEYVYLNIHRNDSGGLQQSDFISGNFWNAAVGRWEWKPEPYTITDARNQDALFIAPFVLDPNDPNRIFAGGASLWRTNDAKTPNTNATGPKWERIKTSAGAFISAIAVARGNPDVIWVGHDNGQIFMTTNGTSNLPSWSRVGSAILPGRQCTSIVISAADPAIVHVTFSGYSRSNLWQTTNSGATWIDLGASLPEVPVRAITFHPDNAAFVYAGSEVGIFASEDGGLTWSPTNEGPTNCSVDDLFWMDKRLICATHGRGMFEIDLSAVSAPAKTTPVKKKRRRSAGS